MNFDKYRDLLDRVEKSAGYWLALTRIEFVGDLTRIMSEDKVSRSEIARRMKTSQPYVSKALNGNDNFTIRTMVKFAQALNTVLHVRLTKPGEVVRVLRAADVSGELDMGRVYVPLAQSQPVWSRRASPAHRQALGSATWGDAGTTPQMLTRDLNTYKVTSSGSGTGHSAEA